VHAVIIDGKKGNKFEDSGEEYIGGFGERRKMEFKNKLKIIKQIRHSFLKKLFLSNNGKWQNHPLVFINIQFWFILLFFFFVCFSLSLSILKVSQSEIRGTQCHLQYSKYNTMVILSNSGIDSAYMIVCRFNFPWFKVLLS